SVSNRINLAIPIQVAWNILSAESTKLLVGKTFEGDTPVGPTKLKVTKVEIYPSGTQLALAAWFSASMQSRLLDVKGVAYLTGDPVLDEDSQVLRIKNLRFTRELDNALWSVLSSVFEAEIRTRLE